VTLLLDENQKKKILSLIQKVDEEYKTNPIYSSLSFELGGPFLFVMLLYVLIIFSIGQVGIITIISLLISFFAVMFALIALLDRKRDKIQEERNYNLIVRNYGKHGLKGLVYLGWDTYRGKKVNHDPLLKALVKIKTKNPELQLENLYSEQPSLFTEKRLIETLL
jgi:hypothetical protein